MHRKTARPEPHSIMKESFFGSSSAKQANEQNKQIKNNVRQCNKLK